MRRVFRWLLRLASLAVALVALALALTYYLASSSLPDYDKRLNVAGIGAEVEIVRDNAGVPHILAQSDHDAFFALGYVHAQDRLWQMMLMRRTAQGRLSEIFGSRTVETDTLLRRLDLYERAIASVSHQDARTLEALKAYSDGINARITEINARALGRGAPEFFLFEASLAPWKPADSIALVKLMALQLSGHMKEEILRARTVLMLEDPARLADILPDMPGAGTAALPDYASLFDSPIPRFAQSQPDQEFLPALAQRGLSGASNAYAAAPDRAAARGTLLANDPHLGFTAPGIWYLARMDLKSGPVIGGTIPGIPAVMVGRSDKLGWGLTTAYLDDQDLYIEQLNPDNRNQYRTPLGWTEFATKRSIINIKDERPVTLTLRWSENGPVLPRALFDLGMIVPDGHVAALRWTALSARDTSMSAAIGVMMSKDTPQAIEASRLYVAPAQNLTLIDKNMIALKMVGQMPRRDASHQTQGRLPSPGWLAQNRWQGSLPYSDNPEFIAPLGGIVGNTNNKITNRSFPRHVSFDWGDSQRVLRWQSLMNGRKAHTRESFIEAQLDTVSPAARTLLPLIGRDLWYTGESAAEGTPERLRQEALALLADWNGEMSEHLPEPLIYAAWVRALQERLIRDELGPLADKFTHVEPLFIERVYRDLDGAAVWCDVIRSARIETCSDIARMALDDALLWLDEHHGQALASLRWGDAHMAVHKHPVLGDVPLLNYFVNIRQSTSGGDHTLMRGRMAGTSEEPFTNVHGAGYRGVYDFSDPDSSVFITSTGQSGHFLSRHYDDLAQLWRRGEYIPMSLDTDLARAASVGVTHLLPE